MVMRPTSESSEHGECDVTGYFVAPLASGFVRESEACTLGMKIDNGRMILGAQIMLHCV